jgi:hypothetical protein
MDRAMPMRLPPSAHFGRKALLAQVSVRGLLLRGRVAPQAPVHQQPLQVQAEALPPLVHLLQLTGRKAHGSHGVIEQVQSWGGHCQPAGQGAAHTPLGSDREVLPPGAR